MDYEMIKNYMLQMRPEQLVAFRKFVNDTCDKVLLKRFTDYDNRDMVLFNTCEIKVID